MWGNVNVNFFAYNNAGKKGIGCGLNGVQKTGDGEPLGGHVTAQEAFQPVAAAPAAPVAPQPAPGGWPTPQVAPGTQYTWHPGVDPITGQPIGL